MNSHLSPSPGTMSISNWALQKNILFVALGLMAALCMGGSAVSDLKTSELDLRPEQAPYSVEQVMGLRNSPDGPSAEHILMCDIDGDGVRELVEGSYQKFVSSDSEDARIKPRWEIHLPENQILSNHFSYLGTSADLNGDRIEEIYFTTMDVDRMGWNFCVLDPASESLVLNTPLPLGEDRRPPKFWDGFYQADGVLQDADGQGNPGIVLMSWVKYDATGRGITVVDPRTGQIIWRYVCGAQPATQKVLVTDLDGDGRREIIFATSAPNNWGGRIINGTTDDRCYLIVLSNRGEELFKTVLGGERFVGQVLASDLDHDGIQEIITATKNGNNGRTNELSIWDWSSRKEISKARVSCGFDGLVVLPGSTSGVNYIFTGTDDGTFQRYVFDGQTLRRDIQVVSSQSGCNLLGAVDILPEPGAEIIAQVGSGDPLLVMDRELHPLAVFSHENTLPKANPQVWKMADGSSALVLANEQAFWVLKFHEKPFDLAGLLLRVGLVLLGLLLLAGAYAFGRMTGGGQGESSEPHRSRVLLGGTDLDALIRLQQEMEDANHSVVGQAKGLQRLVWLLDAAVLDPELSPDLERRVQQVLEDYQVEVGPRLFRSLALARQASFEPELVSDLDQTLTEVSRQVTRLAGQPLDIAMIKANNKDLRAQWGKIKEGFLALRGSINTYFTTDPVRLIQGMLLVREGDFQREKVTAQLQVADGAPGVRSCRVDNGDLRFVLDNLLDNALRAMKEGAGHRLDVNISREGTEVRIQIRDTGHGIAPEQQEAIFSSRFSSRAGGGRGLHRSREILDRWGAELLLEKSEPGQGTTFIVKLLAADVKKSLRTREARG